MVLLKNDKKTLPFESGSRIVVIGPHAKAQAALVGNYLGLFLPLLPVWRTSSSPCCCSPHLTSLTGQLCPEDGYGCIETPLEAIGRHNKGGVTLFEQGCPLLKNDTSGFPSVRHHFPQPTNRTPNPLQLGTPNPLGRGCGLQFV